jgi:hypothetical protein
MTGESGSILCIQGVLSITLPDLEMEVNLLPESPT